MRKSSWFAATAIALAAAPLSAAPPSAFDPARLSSMCRPWPPTPSKAAARPPGRDQDGRLYLGQFSAAGLQPGGDLVDGKRSWTQDVPLLRPRSRPPRRHRRPAGQKPRLTQGEQIAVRAPTNGQHAVDSPTRRWCSSATASPRPSATGTISRASTCKGKVLVVLINDPDFEGGEGDFGGKAMTYYGRWTYKYEEAARRGAAGVLIVHETAPASYGWATVKNSNTNTMFDIVRENPAASITAVRRLDPARRSPSTCSRMRPRLRRDEGRGQARDFKPVRSQGDAQRRRRAQDRDDHVAQRRRACCRARRIPDETVIYSAHWDHLGVGQPDAKGDTDLQRRGRQRPPASPR